jgi:hypothetical protein
MRRAEANRDGKRGVAEMQDFMVNCIVTKGKSDFGYTLGYNFKNWNKGSSIGRIISI